MQDASIAGDAEAFPSGAPLRAKLVGHTSLVVRLEYAEGARAIFRAAYGRGPGRYRGEIAAFRLGEALGLGDRFAPAIPTHFAKSALLERLGEGDRATFEQQCVTDPDGSVRGALVQWLPGLQTPAFEKEPWLSRWKGWLDGSRPATPEEAPLAAQFSDLVVFDYLTGNFDRWSGGNLGMVGSALRYIDNDGAFLEPMPLAPLAASRQRLLATTYFSSALLTRLRALAARDLAQVFGEEAPGRPLLPDSTVRGVQARMREVLARMESVGTP